MHTPQVPRPCARSSRHRCMLGEPGLRGRGSKQEGVLAHRPGGCPGGPVVVCRCRGARRQRVRWCGMDSRPAHTHLHDSLDRLAHGPARGTAHAMPALAR
eukprot:364244-Chlamydomonas_euryale.AAC.3